MPLNLLCGLPGTGKTHLQIETFLKTLKEFPEQKHYFVVPTHEQVARIRKLILKISGQPGLLDPTIYTFEELIEKLLGQTRIGFVSKSLKNILIKNTIAECREQKKLKYFYEVSYTAGFVGELALVFSQMSKNRLFNKNGEIIKNKIFEAQTLLPALSEKLEEIYILYQAYDKKLTALKLENKEDRFWVWGKILKDNPELIKGVGHIFFDGFYEFDPIQWFWFEALSENIKNIHFNLTDQPDSKEILFEIPRHTRKKLIRLGFKTEFLKESSKRFSTPALHFLSENLFQNTAKVFTPDHQPLHSLEILTGMTPAGEIKAIATQIRKLFLEGVRPSEIMVIYRNLGTKLYEMTQVFNAYEIPVEIHERRWFKEERLIRLLKNIASILTSENIYEEVFEYLKTVAPENYELLYFVSYQKHLIGGAAQSNKSTLDAWKEGFQFIEEKFQDLNQTLKKLLSGLFDLQEQLLSAATARSFSQKLKTYLEKQAVESDFGILKELDILFQDIDFHFENENLDLKTYFERLLSAIEIHLVSAKSPLNDSVQVYTATMARQKEYPYVFLAGLVEKEFPVNHRESPILRDSEIEFLGWEIPTAKQKRLHEPYLFYLSATRAQNKLYLCYPQKNSDYRSLLKSFYLEEVLQLFPEDCIAVQNQNVLELGSQSPWVHSENFALNWVFSDVKPALDQKLENIIKTISARSDTDEIQVIFDRSLNRLKYEKWSATALEKYNQCSYKFFAENILKIDQSSRFADTAIRTGEFLHEVLKEFFETSALVIPELNIWQNQLQLLAEKKRTEPGWIFLTGNDLNSILLWKKIKETLNEILILEYDDLKTGRIKPLFFEKEYEYHEGALKFLGRMDRIDQTAEGKYLIKDYKKSYRFEAKKIRTGNSLQILFYIWLFSKQNKEFEVIGAEIVNLKDQKLEGLYQNLPPHLTAPRKNYLKTASNLEPVMNDFEKYIKELISDFENKPLAVNPKTCQFCDLRPLCRFENWRQSANEEEAAQVIRL